MIAKRNALTIGTALPDQTGGANAVVWFITGLMDDLFPACSARTM